MHRMGAVKYKRVYRADCEWVHDFMTRLFALRLRGLSLRPEGITLAEVTDYLPKDIDDQDAFCVVAEINGEIVAMLTFSRYTRVDYRHCGDFAMAVLPGYWRRGIGSSLLQELEQWCRAAGVRKIELGVWAGNDAAVRLYERHGYHHEGCRKNSILRDGKFLDMLLMGKMVGAVPEENR